MSPLVTLLIALASLTLLFDPTTSAAATPPTKPKPKAKPKPWVTFENATYVEAPHNDGDSFLVRSGKKTFHIRLYFADTPETNLADPARVIEQAAHFGVTTNDVLQAGARAAAATRERLRKPFTVHTRWTVAGGRSRQQRFYGFVDANGKDLAEWLVEQGWARAKGTAVPSPAGEPSKSIRERLQRLEASARQQRRGLWKSSSPRP